MSSLKEFKIETGSKQEFFLLDKYLNEILTKSGVKDGIMVVFVPHTTAGVTINENADPDVKTDLKKALNNTFPNHDYFIHAEGNSDGHMKSSLVGASETLLIQDGRLVLGTWQSIYFTEFDGPRTRKVFVKILEG
ncbi:MAG: YjbQ family protein [Alkalibacterium sp.]|nr:YjbQ family protein [Alkalibacterium sp.]